MSAEILSLIKNGKQEKTSSQKSEKKATWLIFTIGNSEDGNNQYAIPAESVKEILRDATVFPLPFVPHSFCHFSAKNPACQVLRAHLSDFGGICGVFDKKAKKPLTKRESNVIISMYNLTPPKEKTQ